jgi:hypothetical protein
VKPEEDQPMRVGSSPPVWQTGGTGASQRPQQQKAQAQVATTTGANRKLDTSRVEAGSSIPTASVITNNPAVGPDPFYTAPPPKQINLGLNGLPTTAATTQIPVLPDIPIQVQAPKPPAPVPTPVTDDAKRRVSGILRGSNGVFAVLEVNGSSQTVQPGDTIGGDLVVAIQDDGVVLRTEDNHTVLVPLSDTAESGSGQ